MNKIIKISLSVFAIILVSLTILAYEIFKNGYIYSYTSPYNYTKVFPYIAKVTADINDVIYKTLNEGLRQLKPDADILYVNGYGSGFVKGNDASSDYDYSTGIYLGKYNYNGENADDIAKSIGQSIAKFQIDMYRNAEASPYFIIQGMNELKRNGLANYYKNSRALIAESIKSASECNGKPYNVVLRGLDYHLDPDEIILPSSVIVKLYSDEISYSKKYAHMIRELTILCEFYVDIETEKGVTRYEMVSEAVGGRRDIQTKFKKFIPSVFTNVESIPFAIDFYKFEDNEEYLRVRMSSYCSHYENPMYMYAVGAVSPIKSVKRILQDVYAIYPILPKEIAKEIINESLKVLQDDKMIAINDYYVILENIKDSTKTQKGMYQFKPFIKQMLVSSRITLDKMQNELGFAEEEIKPLREFQDFMEGALLDIRNTHSEVASKLPTDHLYKLMSKYITNKDKLVECSENMNKVLETAGIYRVQLWQDQPNHVYIIKNDFTKKLDLTTFAKLESINGYQAWAENDSTKFDLLEMKDFHEDLRSISNMWVIYNQTPEQKEIWTQMQNKLLKDRHKYNIKIRVGFPK